MLFLVLSTEGNHGESRWGEHGQLDGNPVEMWASANHATEEEEEEEEERLIIILFLFLCHML